MSINFLNKLPKGGNILDAGCGIGRENKYVTEKGFEPIGIDFSENMISESRKKYPCGQFEIMDLSKLTFKENSFDGIIFINTFSGNYTYSASIKALCFPLYLEILLFVNTFIFITLEDESEFSDYIGNNLVDFLWRCLLPIILVKVYFYSTRYFYNLESGKLRNLLYEFKTNKKSFDKHYFYSLKKIRNMMIFETILFFLMAILTYIFVFGLFAVYPSQGKIMFVSLIFGILIDLALNFVLELLIAILFICRKNHVIVVIIDYMNRMLSYKMLSP